LESVDLPERTEVEVVLKAAGENPPPDENLKAINEILSERFHSGEHDLAARHNEHQP